ncbi:MAG TPA: multifunctional CCA addition/repair protein [Gammaproteobacteria bacterium]|nr:multifunctional CCA addition/repair protein [Gammaproteobacteria bacterium]
MNIYLVGGAVRDELLGLEPGERDWVVVGATPDEMLARGFRAVGRDFPVFLDPKSNEEHALARTERKTAPGYRGFAVHASPEVTLEEDLKRRDLTINAMARDAHGRLIDPYGGRRDLESRILRHVSGAFVEDPLRVLRIARFAARFAGLGFTIADETLALMREIAAGGEMDVLVPERVWQETRRALGESRPDVFFATLRECGALARVFPEIDALFGVPQPPKWHPEIDTGVHTLMVLRQAAALSDDLAVRFAALTHDLGKGETPRRHWPSHPGHEARSVKLVDALADRLRIPNELREVALRVAEYHGHCHRAAELKPATVLKVLEAVDAFRRPRRLEQFLLACEADARGRAGLEDRPYPQADLLRRAFAAAAGVNAAAIAADAGGGAEIARRLRDARRRAIKALGAGPR